MRTIYRAFDVDGPLAEGDFFNEESCRQYEETKSLERFKDEIIGIGCGDEILDIRKNGLYTFFENAILVKVKTQRAADFIKSESSYANVYVCEVGTWYWDSNKGHFISLEDKKRDMVDNLKRLSDYSEMLENM